MKRLLVVLAMLHLMAGVALCSSDGEETAYHVVVDSVKGPFSSSYAKLSRSDIAGMFAKVFTSINCEHQYTGNCTQCSTAFSQSLTGITTSSEWNDVSLKFMYAVLNVSDFCQNFSLDTLDYEKNLIDTLNGSEITTTDVALTRGLTRALKPPAVKLIDELIKRLLEKLSSVYDEHHEDGKEEEAAKRRSSEITQCYNEAVLLYYLGMDNGEIIDGQRIPELVGYLVAFIVQDWTLKDGCEVKPRSVEFFDSLTERYGTDNILNEEGFDKLLSDLKVGKITESVVEIESSDDGHGHKRSVGRYRRSEEESATNKCFSEANYRTIFNLDLLAGVTRNQFSRLCPALIQQVVGNYCVQSPEKGGASNDEKKLSSAIGYGTLAVIIISLTAAFGVILLPCLNNDVVDYIIQFFIGLGVGTLLADAFLHLIPAALGLHSHGGGDHDEEESSLIPEATLLELCACLAVYFFFLFEGCMSKLLSLRPAVTVHSHANNLGAELESRNKFDDTSNTSNDSESRSNTRKNCFGIHPVALNILVGDSLHNLLDGLAIGVAFASSTAEGIGTSVAIFCHELPHELSDFSILLHLGMSKSKAVLLNLLSAATCLVGFYIAVTVGGTKSTGNFLLAFTGGMFVYISLVDMLPTLTAPKRKGRWWLYFLLQNIGFLLGISILLVISVFEKHIVHL